MAAHIELPESRPAAYTTSSPASSGGTGIAGGRDWSQEFLFVGNDAVLSAV
jgi:hypothetical protein